MVWDWYLTNDPLLYLSGSIWSSVSGLAAGLCQQAFYSWSKLTPRDLQCCDVCFEDTYQITVFVSYGLKGVVSVGRRYTMDSFHCTVPFVKKTNLFLFQLIDTILESIPGCFMNNRDRS